MVKTEVNDRASIVQMMFSQIAPNYDQMNRIMTFGQDSRWRKTVIQRAAIPPGGRLLDLGTGTGDLSKTAIMQEPSIHVIGADFTLTMMQVGKQHLTGANPSSGVIDWLGADAAFTPFEASLFDAVVSGFLLRNVVDLQRCLSEQLRVLKPGGMCVALDTTPPPENFLSPFLKFHLHTLIPILGRLIAKQEAAYRYLPETTEGFLRPEQLAARFREAGFESVGFELRMLGTIAIHWGRKPDVKSISL